MSKMGLFFLSICVGLVAGLLLGYAFFHESTPRSSPADVDQPAVPDSQQYFYRLNDSLITRHTVSGTDGKVLHRVDTIGVQER
jgi:hypothetical protein